MSRFRFSAGPWNVHEGEDAFGPGVRTAVPFEEKLREFAGIGLSAVQFHDDDAVPDLNGLSEDAIRGRAREIRGLLDKYGLSAEFVAPRLWMDPHTADGGFTSNDSGDREFALWRALRSIDIARVLGCDKIVLWLAREGTLCAESKDTAAALRRLTEAIDRMLTYDAGIRVLIEPKPNEPIDRSFCPTAGHVVGLSYATVDPARVGVVVESAHAILAGLDPAIEMAYALTFGKLGSVHLNDQNGMRYDQDKSFGSENLRQAFNQVKVLCEHNYGSRGEYVGLDVKTMRTQKAKNRYQHLVNSMRVVERLEQKVAAFDYEYQKQCIARRDYETLEGYVLELLLG